jgi:pullulanase/glycogen debranching enzyme
MHVDGFRFDLASTLARELAESGPLRVGSVEELVSKLKNEAGVL